MKKIFVLSIVVITFFIACKKSPGNNSNETCTTATVKYGGDPALDGVGWVLVTDSVNWKYLPPEEIPSSYKADGLLVDVCYITTDKDFVCFCAAPFPKVVRITSIARH